MSAGQNRQSAAVSGEASEREKLQEKLTGLTLCRLAAWVCLLFNDGGVQWGVLGGRQ